MFLNINSLWKPVFICTSQPPPFIVIRPLLVPFHFIQTFLCALRLPFVLPKWGRLFTRRDSKSARPTRRP